MTRQQPSVTERAAEARVQYLEDLKSTWKVPLSREQYAGIRRVLTDVDRSERRAS